ncbi:MAG: BON domain-containing protein [Desulfobulbaceae bacterium]|nr:BON domain-containing protein [Desulfobulbaceae bacterium]
MLSSYLVSRHHRLKRPSRREGSTGKRIPRPGAAAFILLLALCCFVPATARSQDKIDDSDIARAVEVRLIIDKSVPAHLLDVSANEGVVTLAGSVDSLHARKQAVQITETVRG